MWAAKEWNLVQDAYTWTVDALPVCGANRKIGLMRPSVKMCVWLGPKDCYRNQQAVLRLASEKTSSRQFGDLGERQQRSHRYRNGAMAMAAAERGGTTPFNLLPISNGGGHAGHGEHQASTSRELASYWCRYLLPPEGVLLDCFSGSGTILAAGLEHGARQVIGIERKATK